MAALSSYAKDIPQICQALGKIIASNGEPRIDKFPLAIVSRQPDTSAQRNRVSFYIEGGRVGSTPPQASATTVNDPNLRSKPESDPNENLPQHSSKNSEAADLDLVRQLQGGNHDALTVLFEKYSRMVFLIARRILRDDGEAEEVVQQVFIDAYRAINQFDERKGSFKTWLFCYSYNRTVDRQRYLGSKRFHSRVTLEEQELPMEAYLGGGRRIRLCPQEVAQLVEQLLKSIQPRQRTAIELTFFNGLTAEEIAHKTGETAAVVRHNLYRGLSKLRAALMDREDCAKASPAREVERIVLDPARLL